MNTSQLLQRCQSGDEAAINSFIQANHPALYRLAYSVLLNADDAEEVVQDTLIAALNSLESFNGEALKPWLYGIALNQCRMKLRRQKALDRLRGVLQILFRVTSAGPTHPEKAVIANETNALLWRTVCALGEKHRLPVVLYYYHDLPVIEIARLLQISEGTVHSRLFVARERLRSVLYGKVETNEVFAEQNGVNDG
jgi:RNA polymerase sigma-70 factor, ECF subfamily